MNQLISVIMPTFNCAEYISDSIRSVLSQSYTNWELIIVDDCSTDNTRDIVSSFCLQDPRIHYYCLERNSGAAIARNRALQLAKGDYIAFLDSDDLWTSDKLECQLDFMMTNGYDFSYHEYTEIDEHSKPLGIYVSGIHKVSHWNMKSCCWPGCLTVMYNAKNVGMVQIRNVKKNNDTALWLQISKKTPCFLLKKNLAFYRRRKGSISPSSYQDKIRWTYRLFRDSEKYSVMRSVNWTTLNIVTNSIKKTFFVNRHYSPITEPKMVSTSTSMPISTSVSMPLTSSISVLCPCLNEETYIQKCIDTMLTQDYNGDMEFLFIDGRSTDHTREIIEQASIIHPQIRLIDNPERIVPFAINRGIQDAHGDIIIRIDAHSFYPDNYISTLVHYLTTLPNAQNVGAICNTIPANDSRKAVAIATVLSHPFGVGTATFRTGTHKITETSTVPFGCWRKELFDQIGGFDVDFKCDEDDEFNARIIQNGGRIYLIPDITIDYVARDSFSKLWRMYYQYGLFKPLVNTKLRRPATFRQFVPPLFILALFFVWPLYLIITSLIALRKHNIYVIPAFFCLHVSYGLGYWVGMHNVLTHKPFTAKLTR